MYLAPNPVDLFAKAVVKKGRLVFKDDSSVTLRFWTGQKKEPFVSPGLQVIRALRADGVTELDPSFFTLRNCGPIKGDPDGATRVELTFHGKQLGALLDTVRSAKLRRSWLDEFVGDGARSLSSAFVRGERIYLYVAEVDAKGGRIPRTPLGGLFLDLSYGAKRPKPPAATSPTAPATST